MSRVLITLLIVAIALSPSGAWGQDAGKQASATASPPALISIESPPGNTFQFRSSILDQDRMLFVHLPEGYENSARSYPVHFVLDGEYLFRMVSAHVEFLAEDRIVDMLMPETIVIGIANIIRDTDYTPTRGTESEFEMFPNSGGGETFLRFMAEELIPIVDANFRTNGYRLLTGWSFGGLFTVYAMTERPGLFNAYHAISPSIWWDEDLVIEAFEKEAFARPTKLFTSLGSLEVDGWTYRANKRLAKMLTETPVENLEFTHIEIPDVGHHLGVPHSVDRALRTFYKDYLAPGAIVEAGRDSVKAYYKTLSKIYGYEVAIPYRIYESLGMSFWQEGQDKARPVEIFRECVEVYPDYPMAHLLLGLSYEGVGEHRLAAESIEEAIAVESRRVIPDASNLWLFRARLEGVEKKLEEAVEG